jgi:hypothetical protein
MYREGQLTHFNQVLEDFHVPRIWKQVLESSQFYQRREAVAEFNAHNRWKKRGIAAIPTKYVFVFIKKLNAIVYGKYVDLGSLSLQDFLTKLRHLFISIRKIPQIIINNFIESKIVTDQSFYHTVARKWDKACTRNALKYVRMRWAFHSRKCTFPRHQRIK